MAEHTEKERRVYYQSIVYAVCGWLDHAFMKRPGTGVVCGTIEEPSKQVQDQIALLVKRHYALRGAFCCAPQERQMPPFGILVRYIYLDSEGICDREMDVLCDFLPRVGEKVLHETLDEYVTVHDVYHQFRKENPDTPHQQAAIVVAGDPRSSAPPGAGQADGESEAQ